MAVGGALFSGGGRAAPASKALVEFRAGKMNLSGTTVTPDKRKGLVMVEQGEDDLMHFKWKDRTSGNVEDDLIIFPDDIEFRRVAQCTTGRVYILKFKSSSRKLFFWMQEPKEDKDEEFCKKVNDYLNNPPAAGTTGGSGRSSAGSALAAAAAGIPGLDMSNLRDSELQSLLNHMSQQQLMQLFGEAGGQSPSGGSSTRQRSSARAAAAAASTPPAAASTAAAATPAVAASAPVAAASTTSAATAAAAAPIPIPASSSKAPIQLTDLQSILSGIKVPSGAGGASASGPEVDLSQGLTTDLLQPLLENEEFVRKMKDLLPTVPGDDSGEDAASEIKGTVQSPQFKQALSLFSSGLQTGQLAPLIREFELGDEAVQAAAAGDMEAFVKALQKKVGEKVKEEVGMDLD